MPNSCSRRAILETLVGSLWLTSNGRAGEIPTSLTSIESAHLNPQPFGDLRVFLEGETEQLRSLTVGSLELRAGQSPHPPHAHAEEEIILITAGHGEISLEGKITKVGPGTIMYAGSNRMHGIVNTSNALLTFYFFKWIGK